MNVVLVKVATFLNEPAKNANYICWFGWATFVNIAPRMRCPAHRLGPLAHCFGPIENDGLMGGDPYSQATPGCSPCHQYTSGRMIRRGKYFPWHPPSSGYPPGGGTTRISSIYFDWFT